MRYASKGDSNIRDAGDDPAAAVADPGCSGDEFAPDRGATGTDKSESGAGEKLSRRLSEKDFFEREINKLRTESCLQVIDSSSKIRSLRQPPRVEELARITGGSLRFVGN